MATERQIAANRANAKRSTGPKTAAGKMKSSRNSYKHGLSRDLPLHNPAFRARMDEMMETFLDGREPTDENMDAAAEFAEAQLKLLQVRRMRMDIFEDIDQERWELQAFSRLVTLNRYERLERTKRRRASEKLLSPPN
jgi:hypothetical protein